MVGANLGYTKVFFEYTHICDYIIYIYIMYIFISYHINFVIFEIPIFPTLE